MVKTAAEWIVTLFAGNVAKENDLLLPALTGSVRTARPLSAACIRRSPVHERYGTGVDP